MARQILDLNGQATMYILLNGHSLKLTPIGLPLYPKSKSSLNACQKSSRADGDY